MQNGECPICLDEVPLKHEQGNPDHPLKDEQLFHILKRCGHGGHPECLYDWFKSKPVESWKCVLCQQLLKETPPQQEQAQNENWNSNGAVVEMQPAQNSIDVTETEENSQ